MSYIKSSLITWGFIIVIAVFFFYFVIQTHKMRRARKMIDESLTADDVLTALEKTSMKTIVDKYRSTINVCNNQKSNIPSSEFFSLLQIAKSREFNLHLLDSAAGTLVGLGLLGTFAGLTFGIQGFKSDSAEQIQSSINGLLGGMGAAFWTSLVGMVTSLFYTCLDKHRRNRLQRTVLDLTEALDAKYYIDDMELMKMNQQDMIQSLYSTLNNDIQAQTSSIVTQLSYTNSNGQNVTIANAIREILAENTEQSKALKSFSTDLAIELNNGFDEALSRQMQIKILPLMESVDATTKAVVEHIDQMAQTISSPATDMMQNVVDDLKSSMKSIIKEFSHGLSGSATAELENLASQLGSASQAMSELPKDIENISVTLQDTVEQVKDVMSGISQSSQEQNNQMVKKLANAADKMGAFLSETVSTLSSSVQQSVKNITDDVSRKQANLIALQENTTTQTKKLLDTFNAGLDRLEKMNEYITGTMNVFKQAQGEIPLSTGNLRTISGEMKLASESLNKGQNDFVNKLAQLQTNSQHIIDQVTDLLKDSGQLSNEYAQKFEIIKTGLSAIFDQIQNGLTEYSRTVKATTDKYLEQYASNLTQTTGALATAIERQSEVADLLSETVSKIKR